MGKRAGRPAVLEQRREIGTDVSRDMADALDELVAVTGEARTSVIRRGIGLVLAAAGVWDTDLNARIPVTTNIPKENR